MDINEVASNRVDELVKSGIDLARSALNKPHSGVCENPDCGARVSHPARYCCIQCRNDHEHYNKLMMIRGKYH